MKRRLRTLALNNWKVVAYLILILACLFLAPERPIMFIYTEF